MKLRDVLTLVLAGGVVVGLGGRDGSAFGGPSNPLNYASSGIETLAENLEAASTGRETGTPEGDRAHELAHEADLAYERFAEAWHDAEGHSQ